MNDVMRRAIRLGWPILVATGMIVSAISVSWWTASVSQFGASLELGVGLRGVEACSMGQCQTLARCALGCSTLFTTVGTVAFIALLFGAAGVIISAAAREFASEVEILSKGSAKIAGAAMGFSLFYWMVAPSTFSRAGLETGWGFYLALLSSIGAMLYLLLDTKEMLPLDFEQADIMPVAMATGLAARAHAQNAARAANLPASGGNANEPLLDLGFSRAKFVTERCHFSTSAIQADSASIPWRQVKSLSVRRLPESMGGGLILDIIAQPEAGVVGPIRIDESTEANFEFIGREFPTFEARVRNFCGFVDKQLPQAIELRSTQFVRSGMRAPQLMTEQDMRNYDAVLLEAPQA